MKGFVSSSIDSNRRQAYQAWIDLHAPHAPKNYCVIVSRNMVLDFPELRVVGRVDEKTGFSHMWCIDPMGNVVDPTSHQFPYGYDYEPWFDLKDIPHRPCSMCGAPVHAIKGTVCSLECAGHLERHILEVFGPVASRCQQDVIKTYVEQLIAVRQRNEAFLGERIDIEKPGGPR